MAWKLAKSLQRLRDEVQEAAPGTTVWDIGDRSHRSRRSDHNPNSAGVVCAIDVVNDAGLDLADLAEQVRTGGHPAAKYVIYNRRIASRSRGWRWRRYTGSNPHSTHVHISVGRGGDGRSTGPYDDTSPWGVADIGDVSGEAEGLIMSVKKGDGAGLPHDHPLREAVKYYQRLLVASGHDTVRDGDPEDWRYDGIYGDAMQAAVSASREEFGAEHTDTERVTGWNAMMMQEKVFG